MSIACIICATYITTGISYRESIRPRPGQIYAYDVNVTKNPYAHLGVGIYILDRPKIKWVLQADHDSSISTGMDRGINSIGTYVTYRFCNHD